MGQQKLRRLLSQRQFHAELKLQRQEAIAAVQSSGLPPSPDSPPTSHGLCASVFLAIIDTFIPVPRHHSTRSDLRSASSSYRDHDVAHSWSGEASAQVPLHARRDHESLYTRQPPSSLSHTGMPSHHQPSLRPVILSPSSPANPLAPQRGSSSLTFVHRSAGKCLSAAVEELVASRSLCTAHSARSLIADLAVGVPSSGSVPSDASPSEHSLIASLSLSLLLSSSPPISHLPSCELTTTIHLIPNPRIERNSLMPGKTKSKKKSMQKAATPTAGSGAGQSKEAQGEAVSGRARQDN